ncbi:MULTISPECIES: iron chelate uptake ABC transporter family permease subunit [Glaesserella]|uniref:Iron ABC transporter permease n=1 Tax=Glaesserella australis TaxID=2094024 RepID=A0A328BXY2_9PAST|nr:MULTISPECIES: iron chelate uptake ABC transporter family permease subunit [Glaesserella]AUI66206.1 iron ABC transporter permease [Glaesserella sp. 15-184]RAL19228.1 iron ABC transporter permease [Glaesserella australis]
MRAKTLLLLLGGLFLLSCCLFMSYNANGNWDFVLPFRSKKLLMLIVIGYTIGVSTLLFQTLTHNPILTPSILGFDYLYLLIQTALVFFVGGIGFTQLDTLYKFFFEAGLMLVGSLLLFATLNKGNSDLSRMILVGVIFGVLFRNLNNLLQRMIDPDEFAITQTSSFANFNSVKIELLYVGIAVAIISFLWIWKQRHQLDVLLLGKEYALSLGVNYLAFSRQLLICCAILVSVSTALVGPILFLGLLVCAITNAISPKVHHQIRLPVVFFISTITLVLGQVIFEHIIKMQGVLSVVIEFVGGIVFIYLILRKSKR